MKISGRIRALAEEECWDDGVEQQLFSIANELDAMQNKPKPLQDEKPKWFWGQTTKSGIYAFGGVAKEGPIKHLAVGACTIGDTSSPDSWLAYLGPIPEIAMPDKPKQYRTPKLPDDAGKWCEFSDNGFETVHLSNLRSFDAGFSSHWISDTPLQCWAECRIEVAE